MTSLLQDDQDEAKEIFDIVSDSREDLAPGIGGFDRFLNRDSFSVKRHATVAQKDARLVSQKLVDLLYI